MVLEVTFMLESLAFVFVYLCLALLEIMLPSLCFLKKIFVLLYVLLFNTFGSFSVALLSDIFTLHLKCVPSALTQSFSQIAKYFQERNMHSFLFFFHSIQFLGFFCAFINRLARWMGLTFLFLSTLPAVINLDILVLNQHLFLQIYIRKYIYNNIAQADTKFVQPSNVYWHFWFIGFLISEAKNGYGCSWMSRCLWTARWL